MKNPTSALEYPVVIKRSLNYLTVSVPDLGISLTEELPKANKLDRLYAEKIGKKVIAAWIKAQDVMKRKTGAHKPLPDASLIKDSVKVAEKPLTPTKFAKYVGVSFRTIIRDCEKGLIACERTRGGHYKIPHSEIALYKEYLKNHVKFATEPWSKEALQRLRSGE